MLTKCYCVVYHVADFAADNVSICHQDIYQDHNNALLVAKDLAKCSDIINDVYVIDGLTGEVLNTIPKDMSQENKVEEDNAPTNNTEKNNAPTPVDTYKDKNGDTWFRISDGRWRFYCVNRYCADCLYYDEECGCTVREALHEADRNYQVDLAHERMRAKAKETKEGNVSTSKGETKKPKLPAFEDSLDDGTGGVWQRTDDGKWDYDCLSLTCANCAYYNEGNCFANDPMTEEERDVQIKSAKARMKK